MFLSQMYTIIPLEWCFSVSAVCVSLAKLEAGRDHGQVVASLILCATAGYKESISNQGGLSFPDKPSSATLAIHHKSVET